MQSQLQICVVCVYIALFMHTLCINLQTIQKPTLSASKHTAIMASSSNPGKRIKQTMSAGRLLLQYGWRLLASSVNELKWEKETLLHLKTSIKSPFSEAV